MALIEVEKKFIFTDEGRNLLISQDGGVRFAAIGGILVQGLTPVPAEELWNTYRGLTFEQLLDNDNIVIGMPDVSYRSVNTGLIEPVNEEQYQAAIEDIKSGNGLKHMFGTYYKPNRELHSQSGSHYGTYEFTYDKTSLAWDMGNDISFSMLILLGKQYAETDDATFNVDTTQRPVVVGVAQLPGVYDDEIGPTSFEGGIEFLADQNKYICTSLRLQFTLTDVDHDATELIIDEQDYIDMMDKMSIINDGLKTKDEVHIVDANQPDETLAKLDSALSRNTDTDLRVAPSPGSVATQRTMMIADPYYATDLENQWNAGAQVHIVNKKVDKDNETMYKEQIVLTTLESPEDLSVEELTAYYAGFMLRGTGSLIEGNSNKGAGPEYIPTSGTSAITATNIDIYYKGYESPIFRQVAVPEYDKYAVDIFGIENKILDGNNIDKFMFSQRNITLEPADPEEYGYEDDTVNYGYNVFVNSHENYMNANTNNMLIRANGNILSGYSNCNLIFGGDKNLFNNGANTSLVFGSDMNIFDGQSTQGNIVIGGSENYIDNTTRSMYFNGTGLKSFGHDNKLLMGTFNADSLATWIYGCGTSDTDRRNMMEVFPTDGIIKLYKDGNLSVTLGGDNGILMPENKVLNVDTINVKKLIFSNSWFFEEGNYGSFLLRVERNQGNIKNAISFSWPSNVDSIPNTHIYGDLTVAGGRFGNTVWYFNNGERGNFELRNSDGIIPVYFNWGGSINVNKNTTFYDTVAFKKPVTFDDTVDFKTMPTIGGKKMMTYGDVASRQYSDLNTDINVVIHSDDWWGDPAFTQSAYNMYYAYWKSAGHGKNRFECFIHLPEALENDWQYFRLDWKKDKFTNSPTSFYLHLALFGTGAAASNEAMPFWTIVNTNGRAPLTTEIGNDRTAFIVAYRRMPYGMYGRYNGVGIYDVQWMIMSIGDYILRTTTYPYLFNVRNDGMLNWNNMISS